MKRRLISLLLAVVMILALLPATASAKEPKTVTCHRQGEHERQVIRQPVETKVLKYHKKGGYALPALDNISLHLKNGKPFGKGMTIGFSKKVLEQLPQFIKYHLKFAKVIYDKNEQERYI